MSEITLVLQSGLVVAAVLFIGHVWWKTKALIPTVGAMLLAGLVLWSTACMPQIVHWTTTLGR